MAVLFKSALFLTVEVLIIKDKKAGRVHCHLVEPGRKMFSLFSELHDLYTASFFHLMLGIFHLTLYALYSYLWIR